MEFLAGQLGPKGRRVGRGSVPQRLVLLNRLDARPGRKLGAGRKQPLLVHDRIDLATGTAHPASSFDVNLAHNRAGGLSLGWETHSRAKFGLG